MTAAGRVRGSASGYADYRINGTPATADYDVGADFFFASMSATNNTGISGRADSTISNDYNAEWDPTGVRWALGKDVGTAFTILGSSTSPAPSAGQTHSVLLSMSGPRIAMIVDGTLIAQVSDNSTTAKNLAGFFMQASATPSDSIDLHLDNFTATDPIFPIHPHAWRNPLLPQ